MPYANNNGVRIYFEVEGEGGPPVVLAHGGSGNLDTWRQYGYAKALRDEFLLIMYDARGHGRSDRPKGASSDPLDDVAAVLDAVGMSEAHFWGYSMGATTGFDLAIHRPKRIISFILGGMTPCAWPDEMVRAINISIGLFKLRISNPEEYLQRMEALTGHELTPDDREELLSRDAEGSIAAQEALLARPPLTTQQLATIPAPCLVYCGDLDPFHLGAQESVCHIPKARFLSLPGLNHITAFARGDQVALQVRDFLYEVSD
jgi:pimeloyl-ACP methyl ester carboxylesterase